MGIYVEYRQRNGDHDGGGIIWLWLWLWLIANGFCKSDISDRTKEKANESSKSPGGGRGEYMINTQQAKVDAKKWWNSGWWMEGMVWWMSDVDGGDSDGERR